MTTPPLRHFDFREPSMSANAADMPVRRGGPSLLTRLNTTLFENIDRELVLKVKNVNYFPTRRSPVCVVRPCRSATQIRGQDVESRKSQFASRHEVWNRRDYDRSCAL